MGKDESFDEATRQLLRERLKVAKTKGEYQRIQCVWLRVEFGMCSEVVIVGDRGMLTQAKIENLKQFSGVGWISTLRSGAIRKLVKSGAIQLSLFDRQNLAEIESPDFPGERLVVCFNPLLTQDRRRTREHLLTATQPVNQKPPFPQRTQCERTKSFTSRTRLSHTERDRSARGSNSSST